MQNKALKSVAHTETNDKNAEGRIRPTKEKKIHISKFEAMGVGNGLDW